MTSSDFERSKSALRPKLSEDLSCHTQSKPKVVTVFENNAYYNSKPMTFDFKQRLKQLVSPGVKK